MNFRVIDRIRQVATRLNNGRTLTSIYEHAKGEMVELEEELSKVLKGEELGSDGPVGEAIDVILCMVDIIHTYQPTISNDQIFSVICAKLDKWERVYGPKDMSEPPSNAE